MLYKDTHELAVSFRWFMKTPLPDAMTTLSAVLALELFLYSHELTPVLFPSQIVIFRKPLSVTPTQSRSS